jgi:hypothetical protein
MGINGAAIRAAIRARLEGGQGTVRALDPGVFAFGAFIGQSKPALITKIRSDSARNYFDIAFPAMRPHPATPTGTANRQFNILDVSIEVFTGTNTPSDDDAREAVRAQHITDIRAAIESLCYQDALALSPQSVPTGIVNGMMLGRQGIAEPGYRTILEDWTNLYLQSEIQGSLFLDIQQAVA